MAIARPSANAAERLDREDRTQLEMGECRMRVLSSFLAIAVIGVAAFMLLGVPAGAADEPPAPPKPGPEHDVLKQMEGTWEATVKMAGDAKDAKESKGTTSSKMELGGLWLVSNHEGEFAGMKFQGKGMDTYDVGKKKYVGVWADSMGTLPMISEGTYDKDKKTLTMTSEYPGPDGKMAKYRMVTEFKSKDSYTMTMSTEGKDGKDSVWMTITYKRKK